MKRPVIFGAILIAILVGFVIGYTVALYQYAPYVCRLDGNPFTCDDQLIFEISPEDGAKQ